jgi:glutamyl-tRNA reductase
MHLMAGKRNFLSVSGAVEDVKEVFLFNMDDLDRILEATPARCPQHIAPAEQVIDRLTCDFEQKREEVLKRLFARLNGKLTETDKEYITGAFRRFQNQLLHGPISALSEETQHERAGGHTLLQALQKLFRLQDATLV